MNTKQYIKLQQNTPQNTRQGSHILPSVEDGHRLKFTMQLDTKFKEWNMYIQINREVGFHDIIRKVCVKLNHMYIHQRPGSHKTIAKTCRKSVVSSDMIGS